MSARDAILGRIRTNLLTRAEDGRAAAVADRLAAHPRGIVPLRGQIADRDARVALFLSMAEKSGATAARIETVDELGDAVAAYLRDRNLPAALRIGADPRLAMLAADSRLTVKTGASDGGDLVAVSHALGAIAETGTLALLSGPDNPVTLTFLPDHHIVAVGADSVVGDMESLFDRLRTETAATGLPRTVNFVSGPSRSADIEQTIILGAHGPRALHIVVIG